MPLLAPLVYAGGCCRGAGFGVAKDATRPHGAHNAQTISSDFLLNLRILLSSIFFLKKTFEYRFFNLPLNPFLPISCSI